MKGYNYYEKKEKNNYDTIYSYFVNNIQKTDR